MARALQEQDAQPLHPNSLWVTFCMCVSVRVCELGVCQLTFIIVNFLTGCVKFTVTANTYPLHFCSKGMETSRHFPDQQCFQPPPGSTQFC